MLLEIAHVDTPIGTLAPVVAEGKLVRLEFGADEDCILRELRARFGDASLQRRRDPGGVVGRLRAYLAGDLGALDDIPVDTGGTDFQRKVWRALRKVRAGSTISYGDLARRIGQPKAMRAVGLANGANPIPVVIPCHRVIGSDGRLTGYGGGLPRKEWLLRHEGAAFRPNRAPAGQTSLPFAV